MSYHLTVHNGTPFMWEGFDARAVASGADWSPTQQPIGNAWIRSTEWGVLNFLDIADTHISGDSKETWGVLVSYQGEEIVGRYEGAGQLKATINEFGQVELTGMDFREVSLPAFIQT